MSLEEEKGRKAGGLIISMQGGEKLSLEQIRALLEASQEVRFVSEAWLGPALDSMLDQFPFKILGFHSDQ